MVSSVVLVMGSGVDGGSALMGSCGGGDGGGKELDGGEATKVPLG